MATYTEQELLNLLHLYYSDYGRIPTQREIIADDRLPIHHTYRSRFGTLANAVEKAGLSDVPATYAQLHLLIGGWLKEHDFAYYEYVRSNNGSDYVLFNYMVITHVGSIAIDIYDKDLTNKNVVKRRIQQAELSGFKMITINGLEDLHKLSTI